MWYRLEFAGLKLRELRAFSVSQICHADIMANFSLTGMTHALCVRQCAPCAAMRAVCGNTHHMASLPHMLQSELGAGWRIRCKERISRVCSQLQSDSFSPQGKAAADRRWDLWIGDQMHQIGRDHAKGAGRQYHPKNAWADSSCSPICKKVEDGWPLSRRRYGGKAPWSERDQQGDVLHEKGGGEVDHVSQEGGGASGSEGRKFGSCSAQKVQRPITWVSMIWITIICSNLILHFKAQVE